MYKVKLSDMTTNYKQLQAELAITEHKVESMSKEIQKLESDLEETRQELVCDDSNEAEGEIFRRMNTGANSKEMMRRVSLKMFNATCSIISVISFFLVENLQTARHRQTLSHMVQFCLPVRFF